MTNPDWTARVLEKEWDTSRDPVTDGEKIRERLPKTPKFIPEADPSQRATQADTQPVLFINGTGETQTEPQSVGYRSEYVEAEVVVEFVVSGDRVNFDGRVDSDYGGVKGEIKRIFDRHRKGYVGAFRDPGYDIIEYGGFDDNSERRGAGVWTGEWSIRFINFARKIPQ